jgi:hypothetical protein
MNIIITLSSESLDNLKYVTNILLLEYLTKELQKSSNAKSDNNSKKGVVIDVTDD